jgi:hypothetical protein
MKVQRDDFYAAVAVITLSVFMVWFLAPIDVVGRECRATGGVIIEQQAGPGIKRSCVSASSSAASGVTR